MKGTVTAWLSWCVLMLCVVLGINADGVKGPVIIRKKTHHTVYKHIVPKGEEIVEPDSKHYFKRKRKVVKKPKTTQNPKSKNERYEWIRESNKNEIVMRPEKTETVATDDEGYRAHSKVITKEHVEVQEINPLAAFPSDRVVVKGTYKVHKTDPNMQTTSTVHSYDSPTGKVMAEILTELDQIRRTPDDKKTVIAEETSYKPFQREQELESLFDFDPFKEDKDSENEFGFDPFETRSNKVQFDDFYDETEEDESRDELFKKPFTGYRQAKNNNKVEDNDYVESTNFEDEPKEEKMITPFPKIHFTYPRSRDGDSYSDSSHAAEPKNHDEMITPFPKVYFDDPRDFDHRRLEDIRNDFDHPHESESRRQYDYPEEAESKTINITPKTEEQYHYEYDFAGKGQAAKRMAAHLMRAEDHHQPYDPTKSKGQKEVKEEDKPEQEEDHSSERDSETNDETEESEDKVVEATTPKIEENPHLIPQVANPNILPQAVKTEPAPVTEEIKEDKPTMAEEEYDDHFDFLKHDDEDCPYERLKGSETSNFENDALEKYVIYKIYGPLYNSEHEH
ncbi:unnamed protein product [Acanthoscelides obtectus]|uniref:Uncharacterized protein n=1 Tax=Acanthoscelides obtectus TaxID=200917 RepID=A0A9P0MCY4_ACAOB|nr:unnamed protein product [Acanthoscelides obtectus]CAK1645967.1 hypothetical protein AOBTE_LOCUS14363 [Acanthoscelides obtectus]